MKDILNARTYVVYVEGKGYYKEYNRILLEPKFTRKLEDAGTWSHHMHILRHLSEKDRVAYLKRIMESIGVPECEVLELTLKPVLRKVGD